MTEENAHAFEELTDEQLEALSGGNDLDRKTKVSASVNRYKQKGWSYEHFESFMTQYIHDLSASGQEERAAEMERCFQIARKIW